MRVLCAKDGPDGSAERPFEGFLRGKPRKPDGGDGVGSVEGEKAAGGAPDGQPFGFYRPDPEDEERDRVARRLWKQVFG